MDQEMRIRHVLPGRIRCQIAAPGALKQHALTLKKALLQTDGIIEADVRPVTGSVILWFESGRLQPDALLHLIEELLESLPMEPDARPQERVEQSSLAGPLFNAVFLTGYLISLLLRRVVFGTPVSQRLFSATGAVAAVGALPLLRRAWRDLLEKRALGLFPFLALACGLALIMGEVLTALEIIWVLSIGTLLETYAAERAHRSIRDLLTMPSQRVFVLVQGVEVETGLSGVCRGDTLVVVPGDILPVDGTVTDGEGLVDESHITGRWEPETRRPKDWVYAGTRLEQGRLHVRAEKLGPETYLGRMTDLVESALSERGESEKRADVLAVRLMRMGLIATAGTLLLTGDPLRAFSVMLVMACPCATVLAASTAVSAAIANAARKHILIKGGSHLERISRIDTICIDKTGTITEEKPEIHEVVAASSRLDPDGILKMAADAEAGSEHPLAKALIDEAQKRALPIQAFPGRKEIPGQGIHAKAGRNRILVGKGSFLVSEGVPVDVFAARAAAHRSAGRSVLYVARNRRLRGMIALANAVRPSARFLMTAFRRDGIGLCCLISGDAGPVVERMHKELGFDSFRADCLPEEKAAFLEELGSRGRKVLMVGDGVNDTLSFSKAFVSVAMGAGGSEAAIEAADIALLRDDLRDLIFLRRLSRQSLRVVEQNFWMATFTNILGIALGATGALPPVLAGVLHVSHTLGIMINSGRLLHWDGPVGEFP